MTKSEHQQENIPNIPLAIVGMGCIFPQADNPGAFWTNIKTGVDCISEVPETHWKASDYYDSDPKCPDHVYAKMGGFLSPVKFNPMDYGILPNALEAIDTSQLLGLLAVEQALKDAGYSAEREFDRDQVSVILGVTGTLELVIPLGARLSHPKWREALQDAGVDEELAEDIMQRLSDSYVPWQENSFPGLLGNVVAGRISKHFNFGGTNCVVDAACGSSLSAINLAALELSTGKADMVVTGGIDTFNDIFMYTCFSKTPALSPSGHARPYADDADGTTLGEGLGVVVLKRLADAERDGDRIYAVIKGIGSSSDGRGGAIYEPNANGQTKALRRAYQQGGIEPDSVELIEGHGTGTKVGDAIEVSALKQVFGTADSPWCALGSVKSQIGHTKAAAGSAGIIKAALALYHKVLPQSIKAEQPQQILLDAGSPFYLNSKTRPWISRTGQPRRAGVSALGFGGSNFHCLLEEYRAEKLAVDWNAAVQILPLCWNDEESLAAQLKKLEQVSDWHALRSFAASQRADFSADADRRIVAVVEEQSFSASVVADKLRRLHGQAGEKAFLDTPDGLYFAHGKFDGEVAFLFPGQGAQYPDMLGDLAVQFPEFFSALVGFDGQFADLTEQGPGRFADIIYPPPRFSGEERTRDIEILRQTENAQPAIGAVSFSSAQVLQRFGVVPQAVAGHSYGELVALACAEVLSAEQLFELSRLRGEAMAAGKGDRGSMLAVSAPLETIETFMRGSGLKLVLANRNTPTQGVLSGSTEEIEKAAQLLSDKGITATRLNVAAAFHSELVAPAIAPLSKRLGEMKIAAPQLKVYANTTGVQYPYGEENIKQLLAQQLARPVNFVAEVENLYRQGARIFVEVGPGARLSAMVRTILGSQPHQALALDSSAGKRSGVVDLARLLAQCAALGMPVKLSAWDADFAVSAEPEKKGGLVVELTGANHFKQKAKRPPLARKKDPVSQQSTDNHRPVQAAAETVQPQTQRPAPHDLHQALQVTQQSLATLQNLQAQTARLHQQFLEGQQAATHTFMRLIEQQNALLQGHPLPVAPAVVQQPVAAPQKIQIPVSVAPEQPSSVVVPATAQPGSQLIEPAPDHAVEHQQSGAGQQIAPTLLTIVAEKTGYPVDMLELGMNLDSDLGIDSIKRVEILSALQEALPGSAAISPDDLGRLQTLGEIVAYLDDNSGPVALGADTVSVSSDVAASEVEQALLKVVAEKTGYPVDMLELGMNLDSDLGIDSIKRVEILSVLQEALPDLPAVKPEDLGVLQTLGQIVAHLLAQGGSVSAAVPVASIAVASVAVAETLLRVVAEKTGYPVDMLELDMALDSDLGIDSIKRVEILSALQEALPELPAVKPEDLGVLQTLRQIVEHLEQGAPKSAEHATVAVSRGSLDQNLVAETLLAVIAEKTGYPVEMLELGMSLDADLGIDSIKRVEILSALQEQLPAAPAIKPEHLGTLQTVEQIVEFLTTLSGGDTSVPLLVDGETAAAAGITRQLLEVVPLTSQRATYDFQETPGKEVWISDDGSKLVDAVCQKFIAKQLIPRRIDLAKVVDMSPGVQVAGLVILAPLKGTNDSYLRDAFLAFKRLSEALNKAAISGGGFFASVSRLNGHFGLSSAGSIKDSLSGGLAGLVKTVAHEYPALHCKSIDLASELEIESTAAALVDEIFIEAPLEVGITGRGRFALELKTASLQESETAVPLAEGDLVVVSGGARGVTAEVAVALARCTKATLLLLGRSAEPQAEAAWLQGLTDEQQIKKAILAHAQTVLKPVEADREYRRICANREIRATLERVLKAGGRAIYHCADLRDAAGLRAVISACAAQYGPVKGLIHGAGVLADKLIREKTAEQFEKVYGTKISGLRNLLASVDPAQLKILVMFSSSTGRFGRIGQVDYAVANEVLNKIAQQQAQQNPDCRVVSPNWGPWDGGMVNAGLKKVFASEGIEVIDLAAGSSYLMQELSTPTGGAVEVVILGGKAEKAAILEEPSQNIYISKAFDLDLSVARFPFLKSHVIGGKAVLPVAMMVEWMAHAALHNNPGLKFQGFNDLRVLSGVKLDADSSYTLELLTGKAIKSDGVHVVPVEISGVDVQGRSVAHARARILLGGKLPEAPPLAQQAPLQAWTRDPATLYTDNRLFHGRDFFGLKQVTGWSPEGIQARAIHAPSPSEWMAEPLRGSWFADPLVLDSSFQLLILWSFEQYQAGSLPVAAGRYRQYRAFSAENEVEIRASIVERTSSRAKARIEFVDAQDGSLIARIDDYETVIDGSLNQTFQRNSLAGAH